MTPERQLQEWNTIAQHDDCVTADRLCAEDIRAMVARLRRAENALHQIAGASQYGSHQVLQWRIKEIVGIAKTRLL